MTSRKPFEFAALLALALGCSVLGQAQVNVSCSPNSYRACAADAEIASITVSLQCTVVNVSDYPLIVSKIAESPTWLKEMGSRSNVDHFPTKPPKKIDPTSSVPPEFKILQRGDSLTLFVDGWFLASRDKPIVGTTKPGRAVFTGNLDLWPYDGSNVEVLKKEWGRFGHLETSPISVTVPIDFAVESTISPCPTALAPRR